MRVSYRQNGNLKARSWPRARRWTSCPIRALSFCGSSSNQLLPSLLTLRLAKVLAMDVVIAAEGENVRLAVETLAEQLTAFLDATTPDPDLEDGDPAGEALMFKIRLLTFCTVPHAAQSAPASRAKSRSHPLQLVISAALAILSRSSTGMATILKRPHLASAETCHSACEYAAVANRPESKNVPLVRAVKGRVGGGAPYQTPKYIGPTHVPLITFVSSFAWRGFPGIRPAL
jgi:hypothetical protein